MAHRMGPPMLALSGMGFPLTQLVIRRFGRSGALVVETVSFGFLAWDAAMVAGGEAHRFRSVPAALLWLETGAAATPVVAGLPLVLRKRAVQAAVANRPARFEALRRVALGSLFGLHTLRFRISMAADHGHA